MIKVLWFTIKALIIIIAWNLGLQLVSEADTFANIIGVLVIVSVAYIVVEFIINKLKKVL
jgi:hypothetical protein